MDIKFHVNTQPFGYRGNPLNKMSKFFMDDWPLLRQLVPVGTNIKHRYKRKLIESFVSDDQRNHIFTVLEDVWNNVEHHTETSKSVKICCHRHFHPELMYAFKEFLQENFETFVINFIKPPGSAVINGSGSDWIDLVDKTSPVDDDPVFTGFSIDVPSDNSSPSVQGHFKDSL